MSSTKIEIREKSLLCFPFFSVSVHLSLLTFYKTLLKSCSEIKLFLRVSFLEFCAPIFTHFCLSIYKICLHQTIISITGIKVFLTEWKSVQGGNRTQYFWLKWSATCLLSYLTDNRPKQFTYTTLLAMAPGLQYGHLNSIYCRQW